MAHNSPYMKDLIARVSRLEVVTQQVVQYVAEVDRRSAARAWEAGQREQELRTQLRGVQQGLQGLMEAMR